MIRQGLAPFFGPCFTLAPMERKFSWAERQCSVKACERVYVIRTCLYIQMLYVPSFSSFKVLCTGLRVNLPIECSQEWLVNNILREEDLKVIKRQRKKLEDVGTQVGAFGCQIHDL